MHVHTPGELGAHLRQARLERGWTQAELARHAHVSRELIVRTENNHPRLELEKLFHLLKALGQTVDVVEAPLPSGPFLEDLLGL